VTPGATRLLCDRNYGVGSDGILLLTRSNRADFGLRILNPDGSEAEKSGNGLRIFAKYLYEHGHTQNKTFRIDTLGGVVTAELEVSENGRVPFVTVEMGQAVFNSTEIPVAGEEREVVDEEIRVNGEIARITAVSVGNPHCVVFVDELDEGFTRKLGPLLENHELFPNRINVQFAKVLSPEKVSILIWERGAGYTLASGSSSCAVAAACVKNGFTVRKLTVSMPGGELDIEIREDWTIKMRGPVEEVTSGTLSPDLLDRIKSLPAE
jgi:diaminopimelate epimerase